MAQSGDPQIEGDDFFDVYGDWEDGFQTGPALVFGLGMYYSDLAHPWDWGWAPGTGPRETSR